MIGKIGYFRKNVESNFKKTIPVNMKGPYLKRYILAHEENFFLPDEKISSSKLCRTVIYMDLLGCTDKEGVKRHC